MGSVAFRRRLDRWPSCAHYPPDLSRKQSYKRLGRYDRNRTDLVALTARSCPAPEMPPPSAGRAPPSPSVAETTC